MTTTTRRALAAALLALLLPLPRHPGPASLYGASLAREALGADGPHSTAWLGADLIVAALFAVAVFVAVRIALDGTRVPTLLRVLLVGVVAGGGLAGVSFLHATYFPHRFGGLPGTPVEAPPAAPDTQPEKIAWTPACHVDGARVAEIAHAADDALSLGQQAWIERARDEELLLMSGPSCALSDLGLRRDAAGSFAPYAVPDGAWINVEPTDSGPRVRYCPGPKAATALVPLPRDLSGVDGPPVLSIDGEWVGFVVRAADGSAPQLAVRHVARDEEHRMSLAAAGPGGCTILSLDLDRAQVLLAVNQASFIVLDTSGNRRWGPVTPTACAPLATTFRRVGDKGWVAWDGAPAPGHGPRLEWTLSGGRLHHEFPVGREIVSAAVDTTGRYLAVSLTCPGPGCTDRDVLVVLGTDRGEELHRHYLPRGTRTQVEFVGSGLLACTDVIAGVPVATILASPYD